MSNRDEVNAARASSGLGPLRGPDLPPAPRSRMSAEEVRLLEDYRRHERQVEAERASATPRSVTKHETRPRERRTNGMPINPLVREFVPRGTLPVPEDHPMEPVKPIAAKPNPDKVIDDSAAANLHKRFCV